MLEKAFARPQRGLFTRFDDGLRSLRFSFFKLINFVFVIVLMKACLYLNSFGKFMH